MNPSSPLRLSSVLSPKRLSIHALLATLWLVGYGHPVMAADAAPPRKVATVEGITEYQFANGLRLLLFPDQSQAKVSVNMTVLVGSRQEGYGETGMAHLLEHMVFKGTPKHPNIPKALQDHGAQFNGSTSVDRVNYYETLAATEENLAFAINLEADRLVNSLIRKEDLDSEMTVVRNEFERSENSPQGVLSKRIEAAAYEWHNYGKTTIGNRSDIERVPIENLRAFYRKYYQPDNIILVIAGKFEEAKALSLVQQSFGVIPRPERKLDTTWTEEPAQDGERSVTLRRVGDVSVVGLAYHIPAAPHEDSAALQVLANIFTTRPSGRLHKALVETRKASSASAFAGREHDPGLMTFSAEVSHDSTLDEVRDLLIGLVENIATQGVTEEEVSRARQQILKARELSATDTAQIGIALSEWAAQGDWRLYFLHRDRIEKVTTEAVKSAAARYLQRNNRTLGQFIPTEKAERVSIPSTPNVDTLVANYQGRAALTEGESFDPSPANIESRVQRLVLPEGIKVSLLPKKSRGEEVHLTLTLRYGNDQNLRGLETAAGFLSELMLHGTRKLPDQAFRDELDRLKATIGGGGGGRGRGGRGGGGGGASPGTLGFSVQARRDTLPAVLELLRQVLREPALPVDQFEVLKRQRLAGLEQMKSEPAMLGPRLLQRQLNPYSHEDIRYVPTIEESIQRLQATTHEQVVQLWRDYLSSTAGELTIVGDFSPEACLPMLRDTFAGWKAAKPYQRIATSVPPGQQGGKHTVPTPDKANATFVAGLLFPVRDDDPDYPGLLMGNYIFGGGSLSSRLGTRVRQKEGLSYSVGSSLSVSSLDQRGGLTISAICNPQNIGRVEECVREELDRLLREGVTEDELAKAKQGYLQSLQVGRSSDAALTGTLGGLRHLDRTMKWDADFEARLEKLTPDQIKTAWNKHIRPGQLVFVHAGDFDAKPGSDKPSSEAAPKPTP